MRRALFIFATARARRLRARPSPAASSTRRTSSSSIPWVEIHLGPIDMSINKAVVYLMLGSVVTMALGIFLMRARIGVKPGTRQTIGEQIYEVAQTQIAEQGLPSKAIGRWFPYVASLLLFIFVVNLLGFIPLPLTGETWHGSRSGASTPPPRRCRSRSPLRS